MESQVTYNARYLVGAVAWLLLAATIVVLTQRFAPSSLGHVDASWYWSVVSAPLILEEWLVGLIGTLPLIGLCLVLCWIVFVMYRGWYIDDLSRKLLQSCREDDRWHHGMDDSLLWVVNEQARTALRRSSRSIKRTVETMKRRAADPAKLIELGIDEDFDTDVAIGMYSQSLSIREDAARNGMRYTAHAIVPGFLSSLGLIGLGVSIYMLQEGFNFGLSPWLLTVAFVPYALWDWGTTLLTAWSRTITGGWSSTMLSELVATYMGRS